jgi:hypothetical protein
MSDLGVGSFGATYGAVLTRPNLERLMKETRVPVVNPGIVARDDEEMRERWEFIQRIQDEGLHWFPEIPALPNTFEGSLEEPFMLFMDQPPVLGAPGLGEIISPLLGRSHAERMATYRTPEFRARFVELTSTPEWMTNAWPWIVVAYAPGHPDLEGLSALQAGERLGVHPAEAVLDLSLESDLAARFGSMSGNRDEDLQMRYFDYDGIRLGNHDAGAHQGMMCDARYPPHLLGHWVRDRGLSLERAVQMLTTMEAEPFGIVGRGSLTEGLAADVVVFDPVNVADGAPRGANDLPAGGHRLISEPEGIDHVIVNGTVIRSHGQDVVDGDGPLPGELLRHFARPAERKGPLGSSIRSVERPRRLRGTRASRSSVRRRPRRAARPGPFPAGPLPTPRWGGARRPSRPRRPRRPSCGR